VQEGYQLSPTVFKAGGLRFYFFSREESRLHIHVQGPTVEAKFWLEPEVMVAENHGLSPQVLNKALKLVTEHAHEIRRSWQEHFEH
jgi:Domain of unknown function (DUF4160)